MSDDRRDEAMDELLGAYALDAVDGAERVRVEEYLAANPHARAEVARHREIAALLAVGTERPPEGLWDRIAGALEEAPPAPGPRLATVLPAGQAARRDAIAAPGSVASPRPRSRPPQPSRVTVVVVGDDESPPGDATMAEAYAAALDAPEARRTSLVGEDQPFAAEAVLLPNGTGYLAADELPELPDTETWQLWGVYGDEDVISLGVLGNRPDIQAFTAHDDIQALVITREQAGGVPQSTSGAVLVGPLT